MGAIAAVQGSRWPPQPLVWEIGNAPANLAGATGITARMRNRSTGATRDVTGTIAITDAARGEFVWTYSAEDVTESGTFDVQFTATFGEGPTPGRSFAMQLAIAEALP